MSTLRAYDFWEDNDHQLNDNPTCLDALDFRLRTHRRSVFARFPQLRPFQVERCPTQMKTALLKKTTASTTSSVHSAKPLRFNRRVHKVTTPSMISSTYRNVPILMYQLWHFQSQGAITNGLGRYTVRPIVQSWISSTETERD